jgi:hypothetical protein
VKIFAAIRSGCWLNRDRLVGYACILIAVRTIFSIWMSRGILPGGSTDFLSFLGAGLQANHGAAPAIYDIAENFKAQANIIGHAASDGFVVFLYPPMFVLLCSVLALLPYQSGFVVWDAATLAILAVVLRKIARDWKVVLALLSFPTIQVSLGVGQNALLTAALFGAGTALIDRKPFLAGCFLGLVCYKPHFLLLVPLALLAARKWRALIGLCGMVAFLALTALAAFGQATWLAYASFAPTVQKLTFDGTFGYWAYATWYAAVRLAGGSAASAAIVQGLAIAAACAVTVAAWSRPNPLAVRAATLVAATLVANPVILSYDLTLAVIVIGWIFVDSRRIGYLPWEKIVLATDWLLALFGRGIDQSLRTPLLPMIGISLLVIAWRRGHLTFADD